MKVYWNRYKSIFSILKIDFFLLKSTQFLFYLKNVILSSLPEKKLIVYGVELCVVKLIIQFSD